MRLFTFCMPRITLLLLSGGGHTGRNVLAALGQRRHLFRVVTTTDVTDEPGVYEIDAAYVTPAISVDADGFAREFTKILAYEAPALVIPCRDEDVAWLARYAENHPHSSSEFLCGNALLAQTVNDKWLSAEFCRVHRLPFAGSLRGDDEVALDAFIRTNSLPLVAKPRRGADARGIFVVTSKAQAQNALRRADYILQQFLGEPKAVQALLDDVENVGIPLFHTLEGRKRSIQILIGPLGNIEHIVCTINEFVGRNARTICIDDSAEPREIGLACARVFAASGWRGPLNVQCQPDVHGTLRIHEFNARFTGATAARALLGIDEVGAAIRAFTGFALPQLPYAGSTREARESLAARSVSMGAAERFAESGVWSRSDEVTANA